MENQFIGSCVIILDKDQKSILLGKRKNSYKAGLLGMPGGRIELGEAAIDTARREVKEETGLDVQQIEFVSTIKDFQKTHHFIHFVFVVSDYTGEPQTLEPDKCEGWEWYPISDLPKDILKGHRLAIQAYLDKVCFIDTVLGE